MGSKVSTPKKAGHQAFLAPHLPEETTEKSPTPPPEDLEHQSSDIGPRSLANEDFDPQRWKRSVLLGSGAFGTVHLAVNNSGDCVAVKTVSLSDEDPNVKTYLELLKREMRSLRAAGSHPNVVRYYKSTRSGTSVHMFMEYCPGGSIKRLYAREGRIPPDRAAMFTGHILSGLDWLHKKRIVHRDIKCDNVLIDSQGVAKLADFGASTMLGECSQRTKIGTFFWMAPEVLTGSGHAWQADIWSLGCTVMEMMTASRPFNWCCHAQNQLVDLLVTNNTDGVAPISAVITHPLAIDFLRTCLKRDRDSRPAADVLLGHAFLTIACAPQSVAAADRMPNAPSGNASPAAARTPGQCDDGSAFSAL